MSNFSDIPNTVEYTLLDSKVMPSGIGYKLIESSHKLYIVELYDSLENRIDRVIFQFYSQALKYIELKQNKSNTNLIKEN